MKTKKLIFVILFLFSCYTIVFAADVRLAWDANTEPDLAGYTVYWGITTPPTQSQDAGNVTTYTIIDLDVGTTYFFAADAYDLSGNHSALSNILEYTVPEEQQVIRIMSRPKSITIIFE